jgi:hypothetical protein
MNGLRGKYVTPAVNQTAFNCPHCGALTTQYWHTVHADSLGGRLPKIWTEQKAAGAKFDTENEEAAAVLKKLVYRLARGAPFLEKNAQYRDSDVMNVHVSLCYNCNKIAIWLFDSLVWPRSGEAPTANPDLPDDVRADYDEAGLVLDASPRGAAALLRQAVQRLCKHLGEEGKHIDTDIASLVAKGLDPRVQKALDVVRVIENNAVHPGQIDLKDDRPTAENLFGLVNLIAEIMISQPKHIDDLYRGLPEGALRAIEKRDAPKQIEDKSGKVEV